MIQETIECFSFIDEQKWIISGVPATKVLIVVVDREGTILYARNYRDILGLQDSSMIGKSLKRIEPGAKTLLTLRTGDEYYLIDNTVKSLQKLPIKATIFPLKNHNDIIGGLILYAPSKHISFLKTASSNMGAQRPELQTVDIQDCSDLPINTKEKLVFQSRNMRDVIKMAIQVAKTDFSVMLRGETGVGKELIAELIHRGSSRRENPFIKINCAAIPEALLESELFGYEPGSFTGANQKGSIGKFELANHGTIFLDEVGDMPLHMQTKILRVLQSGEVMRVGARYPIMTDVRIIAATNRNLEEMIHNGEFRDDLYYRLNVIPIEIPALRQRKGDIPLLFNHFSQGIPLKKNHLYLTSHFKKQLKSYHWPGNIRELQNTVKYLSIFDMNEENNEEWIMELFQRLVKTKKQNEITNSVQPGITLRKAWKEMEFSLIQQTLEYCDNNKTQAARMLGISRQALYEKIHQLKL